MDLTVLLTAVSVIAAVVAVAIAYLTFRYQFPDQAKRILRISAIALIVALVLTTAAIFIAAPTHFDEFSLADANGQPFIGQPFQIVSGPNNAIYFTASAKPSIGVINGSGQSREFGSQQDEGGLSGITVGPDGNLWVAELHAHKIEVFSPGGYSLKTIDIPDPSSAPLLITVGPDKTVWFTDSYTHRIGRIDTTVSPPSAQEFALPTGADPFAIVTGPDQRLWLTDFSGDKIYRVNPKNPTEIATFRLPAHSQPMGIAKGSDGNLWFTESGRSAIGRITPNGIANHFPLSSPINDPRYIALGPDGAMWFTDPGSNAIGRIDASGAIKEYVIPSLLSAPSGIVAGPDGAIWFAEASSNKIGHLVPYVPSRF
jgi:virginiamycin B lyase